MGVHVDGRYPLPVDDDRPRRFIINRRRVPANRWFVGVIMKFTPDEGDSISWLLGHEAAPSL